MDTNTVGLNINKPAFVTDGYGGGLRTDRDASTLVGGTPGNVNVATYTHTITGKNEKTFEWNALDVLDNYADAGENCGRYVQANKLGAGSTWGDCVEVCDTEPDSPGAIIGKELDVWCSGVDNGRRIGIDYTVGDARKIRNLSGYGAAVATCAFRTVASSATPWAKWSYVGILKDFTQAAFQFDSMATRCLEFKGQYVVGLDFSQSKTQETIRLGAGQCVSFEPTGQITLSWVNGRLSVRNAGNEVFGIDTNTGDLYKKGVKLNV